MEVILYMYVYVVSLIKQVDRLLVSKMVESVSMATTSLISLVQLLDKVKNMVISDHIQREVSSRKTTRTCTLHVVELNGYYHALFTKFTAKGVCVCLVVW